MRRVGGGRNRRERVAMACALRAHFFFYMYGHLLDEIEKKYGIYKLKATLCACENIIIYMKISSCCLSCKSCLYDGTK